MEMFTQCMLVDKELLFPEEIRKLGVNMPRKDMDKLTGFVRDTFTDMDGCKTSGQEGNLTTEEAIDVLSHVKSKGYVEDALTLLAEGHERTGVSYLFGTDGPEIYRLNVGCDRRGSLYGLRGDLSCLDCRSDWVLEVRLIPSS